MISLVLRCLIIILADPLICLEASYTLLKLVKYQSSPCSTLLYSALSALAYGFLAIQFPELLAFSQHAGQAFSISRYNEDINGRQRGSAATFTVV